MSDGPVPDALIAAMSPAERRALIHRLERPLGELVPAPVLERIAALGELPLAVILISGTLRIVRLTATRLWLLDPRTPLWRLPLLP